MKKILFTLLTCLSSLAVVDATNAANVTGRWPTYVDNEECLNGGVGTTCGKTYLNIFPDNHGTVVEEYKFWKKTEKFIGYTDYRYDVVFNMFGYDVSKGVKDNDEIQLLTDDGKPSGYALTGFASATHPVVVQIHLCKYEGKTENADEGTCKWYDKVDHKFEPRQLFEGIKLTQHLTGTQAIEKIIMWFNPLDFKLKRINDNALNSRSVRLPGFTGRWNLVPTSYVGGTNGFPATLSGVHLLLAQRTARLNHRKCTLKLGNGNEVIDFGMHTLSDDTVGQIGAEHKTPIYLSCNGFQETIEIMIGKNDVNSVSGKGVTHTVEKIELSSTYVAQTNKGEKKIGVHNDKEGTPNNLYVEGSLMPNQVCGINDLKIGNNTNFNNSVSDFGGKVDTFTDREVGAIFWKLCKDSGGVSAGEYNGSATLRIQYK